MNTHIKLPLSAREFYVQAYVKKQKGVKKKASNFIVKEAIQSWISLEPQEKQIVLKKYKGTSVIYQSKFGTYLKAAKPTVQRKEKEANVPFAHPCSNTISFENYDLIQHDVNSTHEDNETNSSFAAVKDSDGIFTTHNLGQLPLVRKETQQSVLDNLPPPPPPETPKVINPKDLYEKINMMDKNVSSYVQLNRLEKRPYQDALLAVKRGYLKKYESYLNSLTEHELYKHMVNVVNEENIL